MFIVNMSQTMKQEEPLINPLHRALRQVFASVLRFVVLIIMSLHVISLEA